MAYFFFGSLRDRDILELVIGRPIPDADVTGAELAGYRLARVVDEPYPAPVADARERLEGVLVRGLSAPEIERLAWFEGREYMPRSVEVELAGGGRAEALMQVATEVLEVAYENWDHEHWQRTEKDLLMTLTRSHMALLGRESLDEAIRIWDESRERLQAGPTEKLRRKG